MPQPIYDKLAAGYERAFAPFERWFLARWRQETLSYLPADARILEIGTGAGANFQFYPKCENATASELSFKMIEIAASKKESKNISLLQANAEDLPFAANSFDAAFATLVFCSIKDPRKAFLELQRVTSNRGKVVLLEHVRPPGLLGILFDGLNVVTAALIEDHFNRPTAQLAGYAGLKVVEVKRKAWGIVNLIICEVEK